MIALLALTLSSLGSGATPSAAGNGPSGAASLDVSEGSARCSKAAANAVVKRVGLSEPSVAEPVFRVLCGSFTGPRSQTMVASISGPENVGMLHWAVFRWKGGAWQLLIKRRQAAVLTAAGPDIRETVSIFRAGDPRCCPSGGTKARIWHWNGSRLVAGPWNR